MYKEINRYRLECQKNKSRTVVVLPRIACQGFHLPLKRDKQRHEPIEKHANGAIRASPRSFGSTLAPGANQLALGLEPARGSGRPGAFAADAARVSRMLVLLAPSARRPGAALHLRGPGLAWLRR